MLGQATLNKAEVPRDATELEAILNELSSNNSRFIGNIQILEAIGHKIKNTDFPATVEKNVDKGKPDGLLQSIVEQLSFYRNHNIRLEELIQKLTPLL